MKPVKRLIWGIVTLVAIIAVGTLGYKIIEGWSLFDALYMTIITITTVGYAEVHPLTGGGQTFSIILILGGVGGALFTVTGFVEYMVEGHLGISLGRRQMKNRIARSKDHFIVCGYGRIGREISRVFTQEKVPFVVIDKDKVAIANAEKDDVLYIEADATDEEILKEAGIAQARALIAAVGSDADNTYITLTAHVLRPDIFIEARASSVDAEAKLKRAGAHRITSPNNIGAQRMALLALRPAVVDFVDTVTGQHGRQMHMENITIEENSSLVGITIDDVRHCTEANVVALGKKTGKVLANPSGDEIISAGDSLVLLGNRHQLSTLDSICETLTADVEDE